MPIATNPTPDAPEVTVILRSRNDAAIVGRTVAALARQTLPHVVLGLDNGSTDGTRALLVAHGVPVHDVPAGAYVPGVVLNRGVALARTPIVAFVNSDCPPLHDDFLARLVAPIRAGEADATWGRQVPRADACATTRRDHAKMYGDGPPPASWGPRFSLAVSAIRRALLLERPFSECLQYSEDLEWVVAMTPRGLRVRYVPEARAEHSHDYTLRQAWKRFFEEGRADAAIFGDAPAGAGGRPLRPLRSALGVVRDGLADAALALRAGELAGALRAPLFRAVQRYGYVAGRLAGPRRRLGA